MSLLNLNVTRNSALALCLSSSALFAPLLSISAGAQTNTSSIAGNVVNSQGAVIPEAKVIVRNTDLSLVRTLTADKHGAFRVTGLVSGAYTVEANTKDLVLRRPIRLAVGLGSSTQVTLQLSVRAVRQSTTVTARPNTVEGNTVAPTPNTAEASGSNFVAGLTVTYLPNRDRDFTQFTQISAAAEEDSEGTGVVMAGQRSNAIATEVDGIRFNDPLLGGRRGAQDGAFFLPLTAVREFQIVRTGVTASVGDTNAGLINVVTKSGSNRPRGEAFYTGRPSQFTSSDAFGHSLDNPQNAFGASYSGPLRKDHLFYAFSVEQDFVHSPYYTQFAPQAPGIAVAPLFTAQQGQIVQKDSPTAIFARIDEIINPANTLAVQLGINRVRSSDVGDGLTRTLSTLAHASSLSGQSFSSRIGLTTVLNARAVNQAVIAWSDDHRNRTPNSTAPEFFINGFGTLGGASAGRHLYTSQQVQLVDDVTLTRGSSLFAFGGNLSFDPAYEQKETNLNGRFDYNSFADYLNNNPRRFQQTFATGNTQYNATVRELSLYGDSNIQLHSGLHLSAGLRWSGQWNPQPAHSNIAIAQTQLIPHDVRQWQPRLGLAYTPGKKTVVRLSSGLFAAPTPATFFHRVFTDNGIQTVVADSYFDSSILASSGGFTPSPHALLGIPTGLITPSALVVGMDSHFRNPMSIQFAASVDREIIPKLAFTIGYLHNSTWGLQRRVDENLSAPSISANGTPIFPSKRPIAGVGRLLINQSTAHSSYDGGFLIANAPISRRSQLTINYSLSQTHDDDSNTGPYSYDMAVNPFNLREERAYSSMDARQALNVSAIFNLPVGFKLNPIFVARSGQPYTALVGFDTQHDANDWNDRAIINGIASARNAFRQPAFSDLDFRVVKDFTLKGEGHHLDLFMDIFNVANAQNLRFDNSSTSLFGSAAAPIYSARQPLFAPGVARFGGPREIQFTARLVGF